MMFKKLCELQKRGPGNLTETQAKALLDEVWRLRIVIQVLEVTLKLWRVLKSKGEEPEGILLRQHAAAESAIRTVDGGIFEE